MPHRVIYSVEEAASLLGISPSTMYRWARHGDLRTIPLAGRVAVPATSLTDLMADPAADRGTDENLNQVVLAGRLAADPTIERTRTGLLVATLHITVKRRPTDADPFDVKVVAYATKAETATHLAGDLIRIDGRLDQRHWTSNDGTRLGAHRVVADRITTLEAGPSKAVAS